MKKIVSVSLGPSRRDCEFEARLWGEDFHIRRVGTNGDTAAARTLVREHDGQVDCIALGAMAIHFQVGKRRWYHKETLRIARSARSTPVVGGRGLKTIVDRWSLRELLRKHGDRFEDAHILFLSGIANWDALTVLREHTDALSFADPILHYGTPVVLPSIAALETYAAFAMPFLTRRPYVSFFPRGKAAAGIQQSQLWRFFQRADVVVGDLGLLLHYAPRDLAHKVVVTDTVNDEALERFRDGGVDLLCTTTPQVFGKNDADLQVLHACCVAHLGGDPARIEQADYIELLRELSARPRSIHVQGARRARHKFAYLYYPPSRRDLFRPSHLRWMRTLPLEAQQFVERMAARLPIRAVSRVRGIVSPTGAEAEGWVLYLPVTAQEMRARGPEYARDRLREATRLAARLGASILGVGGFAKEVTMETSTVAREVSIPITSGTSYLVSADLWAAKQAVLAIGIEQDEVGRAVGTTLVAGAADPQGSVAAELAALVFHRVVLVDEDQKALKALAARIQKRSPHCEVVCDQDHLPHLAEADLVVTGYGEGWKGTIDLQQLRCGAVLCDFSRPTVWGPEAADERPDVLFIRAGEIELPGPAELGVDLGPPRKVAFASMAETIVLALEGEYCCYSVGDQVEFGRVKDIYKMGLKHGMQLAGMRGIFGQLTAFDLKMVREQVERRKRMQAQPPPLESTDDE